MALLGIDLGTASVKAVVTDDSGEILGSSSAEYPVSRPRPGWAETDPEAWWTATVTAVRAARAQNPAPIAGIGLSGQMHGLVPTTAGGDPVRPAMLWADSRAQPQLAAYRALPEAVLARLANPLFPGMAGPLLAWLRAERPLEYDAARWALQPKDWVRLRLTGNVAAEPSDASATLLYDLVGDRWDDELAGLLGLDPERLAPLLPDATALAGGLTAAAAADLGLAAGIPVAAGAGDTAASAFGSGVTEPGTGQLTLGSGMQLVVASQTPPVPQPAPVTHTYRAAAGGWYEMAAILNGGLSLSWVIGVLGATYDELNATAGRDPAADDPFFLPHLNGERTPFLDPDLRGAWFGLDTRHDRRSLLRAALEGVGLAARTGLDALEGGAGLSTLRLAGGGTAHPAWRQLLADILGVTLLPVTVSGASGRGAAVLGGIAAGILRPAEARSALTPAFEPPVEPRRQWSEHYQRRLARFGDAVHGLRASS